MAGFWQISPDQQLVPGLADYESRLIEAIKSLGDFFAAKLEAYAKQNAPWTDRTGAARAGLRAFAMNEAARVTLYLVHSVSYGIHLETGTRFMAPRPIILPTLAAFHAPIMSALRELVA